MAAGGGPAGIIVSNNLRPWSLSVFAATLALLLIVGIEASSPRRSLALAAAGVALAVSTVFTLGLLLVPLAVIVIARWRGRAALGLPTGWLADGVAILVAGLVSWIALNLPTVLRARKALHQLLWTARDVANGTSPTSPI